jgi:peptide methionine sulfoxide reductase MsrA
MHGIYFHNDEQLCSAQEAIDSNNNFYQVELKKAAQFYEAENYHQQYLLKGGQTSARKLDKETIHVSASCALLHYVKLLNLRKALYVYCCLMYYVSMQA